MIILAWITVLVIWLPIWIKLMDGESIKIIKNIDKLAAHLIILLTILFVITVINWYGIELKPTGEPLEGNIRADYGALGDYFGGILNPLFGFLGLLILLWTLRLTRQEMLETRQALKGQESEQLLSRLSETFSSQCERIILNLDLLTSKIHEVKPYEIPISEQNQNLKIEGYIAAEQEGPEVLNQLSMFLDGIDEHNESNHRGLVTNIYLLPNRNRLLNYACSLESSLTMFLSTLGIYEGKLDKSSKRQLFIIIESILNFENTYNNINTLLEANEHSKNFGINFSFSSKLLAVKEMMSQLNEICDSENVFDKNQNTSTPLRIKAWIEPFA